MSANCTATPTVSQRMTTHNALWYEPCQSAGSSEMVECGCHESCEHRHYDRYSTDTEPQLSHKLQTYLPENE